MGQRCNYCVRICQDHDIGFEHSFMQLNDRFIETQQRISINVMVGEFD